ncbi:SulP family inorganic anion transporter [Nocardioides conyzicola]|uniref:SulP family inorganic anion transporter n=1 Tax=Nocardioides conyzicola TaxID=1651781 RepID=A0ABP8XBK6_9ACTN
MTTGTTGPSASGWRGVVAPSFRGFRPAWLRGDVVAGLTVWAVLVPESLAYAGIAGVPAVVGLYATVPALVLYALLGSSRHLVVAPMSATAALSAGAVGDFGADADDYIALTAALAIAVGLVAILAGLFRLGFLASFISEPVLKGFIIGLALTIIVGQVPALLGVDKGDGSFFEKAWSVLGNVPDLDALTTAVGVGSLAVLLALRRWLAAVPGSLVVALGGVLLVWVLGLDDHGLAIVGHIDSGLPSFGLPGVGRDDFLDLLAVSVGVMLVGFAEGLGAAKTYAVKAGYDVDADRELLGLGAANLGSGLSGGMVVNGSLSKTAVNGGAGARSQVSGLTAAALTVVTLLFLTGLFEELPEASLAAIVIAAVIELVDLAALRRLWTAGAGPLVAVAPYTRRADFLAAVGALVGVLVFDTLPGLVIGIGISLLLLIARTSRPNIAELLPLAAGSGVWVDRKRHPDLAPLAGTLVVRVEGPLMFTDADFVRDRVRALVAARAAAGTPVSRVVLDGESVPGVDVTAAAMLTQLHHELEESGIRFGVARGIGQVRDVLTASGGRDEPTIFPTIDLAVAGLTGPS